MDPHLGISPHLMLASCWRCADLERLRVDRTRQSLRSGSMTLSDHNSVSAAYDASAAEYVRLLGTMADTDQRDREVVERWLADVEGPVLDAGCGPGHWAGWMHERGHDVTGIDHSGEFVRHARAHFPLPFHHGSMVHMPYSDGAFSGVFAWYSLIHMHPDEIPVALLELARVLRPGGSLLLGYFEGAPAEEFAHRVVTAYFWSAEALTLMLHGAGFAVTGSERRDRLPHEPSTRAHGSVVAVRQ